MIADAIRYGDKHKPTMEMADYWLTDKSMIHKLFKVLCPRFENSPVSATRMYKSPREYPVVDLKRRYNPRGILELRGNPYPPIVPDQEFRNKLFIHNVLLDAAKKDFHYNKAMAERKAADKSERDEVKP